MTINSADIKLLASERMNDATDGGGGMTGTVVQDGVANNVFPNISHLDRVYGRIQLREVYAAVLTANSDQYLGAHSIIDEVPSDPSTWAVLFAIGRQAATRAQAVAKLEVYPYAADPTRLGVAFVSATIGATSIVFASGAIAAAFTAGDPIRVVNNRGSTVPPEASELAVVLSVSGPTVNLSEPLTKAYSSSFIPPVAEFIVANPAAARCYGSTALTAVASSGATSLTVAKTFSQLVPMVPGGAYPVGVDIPTFGMNPAGLADCDGEVPIFFKGDAVVLHSTLNVAPATVTNGQTINVARGNLARLRVIGNNGIEIARFDQGVTPPGGVGCTADLVAGTVTFTSVTGYSQPVTVQHRIEDMAAVTFVNGNGVLTLNRPTTHAFPIGAIVSSALLRGDIQAIVHDGFPQATWTGVFSDTLIGSAPSADYNQAANPITSTNAGAINERWAVIFTSTTTYRIVGETVGEIGTGSTATVAAPINLATSAPYFSIPSTGWGTGWGVGNVFRFNTDGANYPMWVARTVAPSVAGGSDGVTLEVRGDVNT
jgi:hypothetical protein